MRPECERYYKMAIDTVPEASFEYGMMLLSSDEPIQRLDLVARLLTMAADAHIPKAMYFMFMMLHNGVGVQSNDGDAFRYLEMSSDKLYFPALYRCALVMQTFDNVPENREKAATNFKRAADTQNVDAVYHYAVMKKTGASCIRKNVNQSAKYFQIAADLGNAFAAYQYGLMLMTGNGVPPDDGQAILYYKKAAENGFPDAMYQYALILKNATKQTKQTQADAKKFFQLAIDAGVTDPAYHKALAFQTGKNARLKQPEAAECFRLAAEAGNANANYHFALIVQAMDGEPGNAPLAAAHLKLAADGGHVDAAYRYALMLKTGAAGVKKSVMEAVEYFKVAADGGNANAMYQLALMRHMGHKVPKNREQALEYFRKAAEAGNVDAMCQFAFMQERENDAVAAEFFRMAAEAGVT
jgi:TPR repeat protein